MATRKKKRSLTLRLIAGAVLVIALYFVWHSQPGYDIEPGFVTVQDAYRYRQTGFMAEVTGSVVRILRMNREEPDLQKFVIRMSNGQPILVVHNLRTGGEVPLAINDQVLVRGLYTWSETGGVIRNTERDRSIRRQHGWIEHKGERYK